VAVEAEERGERTCPGRGLPHGSAARYFPSRTVKDERKENNIVSPAQRQQRGGGMLLRWGEGRERRGVLTGEQFGKGRSSREVWLQAKVYLYVSEVCEDETWQTEEPVFFLFFLFL